MSVLKKLKEVRVIFLIALSFILLSCSDDSCGNEIIDINKNYERLWNLAEGDQDHREDIGSSLWGKLENIDCSNDSCDGEINRINERYKEIFNLAEGDKD